MDDVHEIIMSHKIEKQSNNAVLNITHTFVVHHYVKKTSPQPIDSRYDYFNKKHSTRKKKKRNDQQIKNRKKKNYNMIRL